jgi:catechol 2,3-dioxygenase-like lactoylglutathione lyase family enzyme
MDERRRDVAGNATTGGVNHVGLEVADIDAVGATLRDRGVDIVLEPGEVPNSGGERYAFIRDNIGALIELYQPTDR